MDSEFLRSVAMIDPALAKAAEKGIKKLAASDRALVVAVEKDLKQLREGRLQFETPSREDGYPIDSIFDQRFSPPQRFLEGLLNQARSARLIVDRLEARHHG